MVGDGWYSLYGDASDYLPPGAGRDHPLPNEDAREDPLVGDSQAGRTYNLQLRKEPDYNAASAFGHRV
jgi:hypothetical protein